MASLFCKSATAINPFIYFFLSRGFREDFNRFLGKMNIFRRPRSSSGDLDLDLEPDDDAKDEVIKKNESDRVVMTAEGGKIATSWNSAVLQRWQQRLWK